MSVTYANVALLKSDDGIFAGVELYKRKPAEGGRLYNEVYHVISYAGTELKTSTIRQAIPVILTEALAAVDPESDTVIFRSFNRGFMKSAEITEAISVGRSTTVKVVYVPRPVFMRRIDAVLLAEDAVRRGYTVSTSI